LGYDPHVFFLLSKILDVLATPLAWTIALVAAGLVVPRWRRAAPAAGLAVLVFFSLEPVSNALFHSLESPPLRTLRPDVTYDAAILLGGVGDDRAEATWGQRAFNDNNERLLETFDLLRSGKARYAIVSGGDIAVQRADLIEARVLVEQLVAWGIDRDRLVVEGEARNTRENAVYSAAIVRARGWHDVIIVTSAFHMPRAYGCFRAVGLAVDTSPVDFRSYGGAFRGELIPRADHLQQSTAALREWLGRVVYRVRGYSSGYSS
jgi:uncharacterized SAM-binding protein YcdF (DUF218 family)